MGGHTHIMYMVWLIDIVDERLSDNGVLMFNLTSTIT